MPLTARLFDLPTPPQRWGNELPAGLPWPYTRLAVSSVFSFQPLDSGVSSTWADRPGWLPVLLAHWPSSVSCPCWEGLVLPACFSSCPVSAEAQGFQTDQVKGLQTTKGDPGQTPVFSLWGPG